MSNEQGFAYAMRLITSWDPLEFRVTFAKALKLLEAKMQRILFVILLRCTGCRDVTALLAQWHLQRCHHLAPVQRFHVCHISAYCTIFAALNASRCIRLTTTQRCEDHVFPAALQFMQICNFVASFDCENNRHRDKHVSKTCIFVSTIAELERLYIC